MRISFPVTAIAVGAALALACATTKTEEQQAAGPRDFKEGGGGTGYDTGARKVSQLQPVFFDFDRSEIRSGETDTLRSNKAAIDANDWSRIVLEGHCDERGTEEYNIALGERRAISVKRYLTQLGVPSDRIQTVSYGESRPAVPGTGEAVWAQNRRVEFGVSE